MKKEDRTIAEYKSMIQDIRDSEDEGHIQLNHWESNEFIPSIGKRLERGIPLSVKQDQILEEIWKRTVS